jgi:hypothetical protein
MHVAFAVLRQGPVDVTVTAGNGSERAEWRRLVQPGGFYVVDRGYVDYSLFQELHDLPCSFLCRVKDNSAYEVQEERALAPAAVHAGVVRDAVLRRLGTAHHTRLLPQPFRVVQVATGKTRTDGTPDVMVLVTNRLDLDAELLAVAYRYRWAVEICQSCNLRRTLFWPKFDSWGLHTARRAVWGSEAWPPTPMGWPPMRRPTTCLTAIPT